ncbi:MAG: long-chain fatty acid--CoA ligase [Acidobacteriota bacterium]
MSTPETLVEMFCQAVREHANPSALMYKRGGSYRSISAAEFEELVRRTALGLRTLGIQKGDRVALLSENRPEWAYCDLGILSAGGVNVPLYSTLPPAQIAYCLNDAEVKVILVSNQTHLEKVLAIRDKVPSLKAVVVFDPVAENSGSDDGMWSLSQVLSLGQKVQGSEPDGYQRLVGDIEASDLASIIYTSGTTGVPKGVMLSHRNVVSNVLACAEVLKAGPQDVVLSFLPLSHIFERTADYLMMYQGASIAYAESPDTVPENLLEVRPTIVASVPRLFEKMYGRIQEAIRSSSPLKQRLTRWAIRTGRKHAEYLLKHELPPAGLRLRHHVAERLVFSKLQQKVGGRLRFFISGGAPLDKELAEFFFSVGVLILEGYGLTETSPVIAVNHPGRFKLGTVGPPVPTVEVMIAADGEILTRGPSVMIGYHRMEEETRSVMEGGWFHTGDIGMIDEDGFLRVTDRKKDLIVTASGKNVAPQKIEGLLKTCPYLLNVLAIGDKRPFISALVVPNRDRLIGWARERKLTYASYSELVTCPETNEFLLGEICRMLSDLAPYEQVKRIQVLESDFSIEAGELTPTMKLRRKAIQTKYQSVIDRLYRKEFQPV